MTSALPFTEKMIARAIRGARAAGVEVGGIEVRPDGTIVILTGVDNGRLTLTTEPKLRDARERLT
jgi:hypothetical protein